MHLLVSLPLIKQAHAPEPPCLLLLLLLPTYLFPSSPPKKLSAAVTERSSFAVVPPPSRVPLAHFGSASSWKVCSPLSSFSSARRSCPWPCSECASGQVSQQRGGRGGLGTAHMYTFLTRGNFYISSKAADQEKGEGENFIQM